MTNKATLTPQFPFVSAIAQLEALNGRDRELDHIKADEILLAALRESGQVFVAEAYERARARIGFSCA